jgi:hypothetical protein
MFLPDPEHDAVIGDLTEQYQIGRSWGWYWRQVLAIVVFGRGREVLRRPLTRSSGLSMRHVVVLTVVIAGIAAAALSDFGVLLLAGAVGGAFIALIVLVVRNNKGPAGFGGGLTDYNQGKETPMRMHRGINTANVAGEGLEGLPGLLIAIAFVFIFLGLFLPSHSDGLMIAWLIAEVGGAVLYLLAGRRDRRDTAYFQKTMHDINKDEK